MRRVVSTMCVLVLLLAAGGITMAAEGDKKADATGTWTWTVTRREGQTFEMKAKLVQDGQKLTGTVTGRQGNDTPIADGKVEGDQISFTVTRTFNGNTMTSKYTGKIDGDTITGTSESNRQGQTRSREWKATRVQEQKS